MTLVDLILTALKGLSLSNWLSLLAPAAFVVAAIWRYMRRARLELTVGEGEPWSIQTPVNPPPPRADPIVWVVDGRVNYYRVEVVNRGKTTARRCHVRLERLWYVERHVWARLAGWEPVDLRWAGRPDEPTVDLSAEQPEFCDVGHVPSNYIQSNLIAATAMRPVRREGARAEQPGQFFLDLAREHYAQPNTLEQGHYVLELTAFSDNAQTRHLFIDVRVSGRFAALKDPYESGPLGGNVLAQRQRPPNEGTLDEDAPPDPAE